MEKKKEYAILDLEDRFLRKTSGEDLYRESSDPVHRERARQEQEEVHEQQGVGIGLYLAREIVTWQGGYIKVISEPGKGSKFSIMLPTK